MNQMAVNPKQRNTVVAPQHFMRSPKLVEDGLEVSFDLYWDSAYWAEHCKI